MGMQLNNNPHYEEICKIISKNLSLFGYNKSDKILNIDSFNDVYNNFTTDIRFKNYRVIVEVTFDSFIRIHFIDFDRDFNLDEKNFNKLYDLTILEIKDYFVSLDLNPFLSLSLSNLNQKCNSTEKYSAFSIFDAESFSENKEVFCISNDNLVILDLIKNLNKYFPLKANGRCIYSSKKITRKMHNIELKFDLKGPYISIYDITDYNPITKEELVKIYNQKDLMNFVSKQIDGYDLLEKEVLNLVAICQKEDVYSNFDRKKLFFNGKKFNVSFDFNPFNSKYYFNFAGSKINDEDITKLNKKVSNILKKKVLV